MKTIEYVTPSKADTSLVDFGLPFSIAEAEVASGEGFLYPLWPPVKNSQQKKLPLSNVYHSHSHFEMIYVLEGNFTEHLENSVYMLNKDEATILNSNIRHVEGTETDCRFLFINFSPDFLISLFKNNDLFPGKVQHRSVAIADFCITDKERNSRAALDFRKRLSSSKKGNKGTKHLLDEIRTTLLHGECGYAYSVESLLLTLFEQFETASNYYITHIEAKADTSFVLFTDINHYIIDRSGRISLTELSSILHYTPDYLGRIIRKETGLSFSSYCQSVWIDKAKKLLTTTDLSISEIIFSFGYESSNVFYRVFHEATGMTPSEFRKKYKSLLKTS